MSKYYAVLKGHQKGIYTSWPQCSAQVTGFSGALYKSFPTKLEALAYLHGGQIPEHEKLKAETPLIGHRKIDAAQQAAVVIQQQIVLEQGLANLMKSNLDIVLDATTHQTGESFNYGELKLPMVPKGKYETYDRTILNTHLRQVVIYIDGSKRPTVNHRGSGAYCRFNQQDYCQSVPFTAEIGQRYGINPEDFDKLSSPTMEYLAFTEVLVRFLQVQTGSDKIGRPIICNPRLRLIFAGDYNGVKHFTEGTWVPEKNYIIKLRNFAVYAIAFLRDRGIDVLIHAIKGHCGILGNELADIMAKSPAAYDSIPNLVKAISTAIDSPQ